MPEQTQKTKEVGYIQEAKRYLLQIRGLPSARVNDILVDEDGNRALVNAIYEDYVEALLLSTVRVHPGIRFHIDTTTENLEIGEYMFGSVIDSLGNVVMEGATSSTSDTTKEEETLTFDVVAPGVDARRFIEDQLPTGVSAVDLLVPVGKGQRELIFGAMDSGKITFLEQMIKNQKGTGVVCIYAAVGKPAHFTDRLISSLDAAGAMEHTIIVSSLSTNETPAISIAPSTAFLIAEHFSREGRDVVLVLDDLGVHAEYLREIALLAGRVPGRESYPGDIFYRHAHLMERAGRFNEKQGNGTITLFPVMETERGNYTNLIPTNLMASTDGHLMFSTDKQTEGVMPAISVTESVTRIGHHTQFGLQRDLATRLSSVIAEYPRHQEYSRFGTELSDRTRRILTQGAIIHDLLNQNGVGNLDIKTQILVMALVFTDLLEEDDIEKKVAAHKQEIIDTVQTDAFAAPRQELENETDLDAFLKVIEKAVPVIQRLWQTS